MHIGITIGLFTISYLIQLLLCFKAKKRNTKLIPLYLCVLGTIYSVLLYVEFFGLYDDGSWMSLKAVIYFICLAIIIMALFIAMITHSIVKFTQRRNGK